MGVVARECRLATRFAGVRRLYGAWSSGSDFTPEFTDQFALYCSEAPHAIAASPVGPAMPKRYAIQVFQAMSRRMSCNLPVAPWSVVLQPACNGGSVRRYERLWVSRAQSRRKDPAATLLDTTDTRS